LFVFDLLFVVEEEGIIPQITFREIHFWIGENFNARVIEQEPHVIELVHDPFFELSGIVVRLHNGLLHMFFIRAVSII